MSKTRKINIVGESAGTVEITILDTDHLDTKKAQIIYRPDPQTKEPVSMLFGYRDITGQGRITEITERKPEGWFFQREIGSNESTDFFLHPDTKPNEFKSKPNIIDKIALKDGKIINGAYEDTSLTENEKGMLKKYVYKDKTIHGLVDSNYKLLPDERFIDIYFPAGYDPNAKKEYGLQVFLDGDIHTAQDPFGQSMGTLHVLDNLIASGKMEPVIAVFSTPTPPVRRIPTPDNSSEWGEMPRLGEYACNLMTDTFLANIPIALANAEIPVANNPQSTCLCGQSMGGLQALYTAERHPDVYGKVIAQSPAVWWGPPEARLEEKAVNRIITYEDYPTWCADPGNLAQGQYILKMIQSGSDQLTGTPLPGLSHGSNIFLQAGSLETGDPSKGHGPLRESTEALANEMHVECYIHDGAHTPDAWTTGLAVAMPVMHPKLVLNKSLDQSHSTTSSSEQILTGLAKGSNVSPAELARDIKVTKTEASAPKQAEPVENKHESGLAGSSARSSDAETTKINEAGEDQENRVQRRSSKT